MERDLGSDPLLRDVPEIEGFKVLEPCVLYAKLGQGGMGAVYRGKHLNLDIDVAVKCLKGSLAAEGQDFVARFQREARLAASIHHQNLVQVYDISHRNGVHYLVMEYVMGETARERVLRKGPLSEAESCRILLGAALGLSEAHAHRIVHRDIKPDNILVSHDGKVKVSDLGLAKALESEDTSTLTHGVMGTPQYMAPEQWADMASVGPAADVWALGATLYFLLSGENGISAGSMQQVYKRVCVDAFPAVRERVPSVSDEAVRILHKCVAREPRERYRDARDLARDLQRLLANDHTSLEDAASGTSRIRDTLVSPPPQQTMARIRVVVDSKVGMTQPLERSSPAGERRTPDPRDVAGAAQAAPTDASARADDQAPSSAVLAPSGDRRASYRSYAIGGAALVLLLLGWLWVGRERPVDAARGTQRESAQRSAAGRDDAGAQEKEERASKASVVPLPAPVAPAPAEPPAPRLSSIGLPSGNSPFVGAEPWTMRGRVENPRTRVVTISIDGERLRDVDLGEDDEFSTPVKLVGEGRHRIEAACEGAVEALVVEVVRDSIKPSITLVEPVAGTITNEAVIDVRVRVADENLAAATLGGLPLVAGGDGVWARRLSLDKEGENVLRIEAVDDAGNRQSREATVVRDTNRPHLVSLDPDQDDVLEGGVEHELTLTFNEALAEMTIDGRNVPVDGPIVKHVVEVGFGTKLRVSLQARDHAGNASADEIEWKVETKPKCPDGWKILDAQVGTRGWARRVEDPATNVVFVLLDGGSFAMGSQAGRGEPDERPQHVVAVDAFYLAETELTQAQWERIGTFSNPSRSVGADLPVETVSWSQAKAACAKAGYRLPTEAEWEYACRAGTTTDFSTGERLDDANFDRPRASERTISAGTFAANAFGLRDMHGNVREWCDDEYRPTYDSVAPIDPRERRYVARGGSYLSRDSVCRSAARWSARPAEPAKDTGFRPAFSPR